VVLYRVKAELKQRLQVVIDYLINWSSVCYCRKCLSGQCLCICNDWGSHTVSAK